MEATKTNKKLKWLSNVFSGLWEWIFWVCIFSALPMLIYIMVVSFFGKDGIDRIHLATDLYFISISILAATMRTETLLKHEEGKRGNPSKTGITGLLLFLMIATSGIYFCLVLFNLNDSGINIPLNHPEWVFNISIAFTALSFLIGAFVEIWRICYENS